MEYTHAPESYRRAYDRLEPELTDINGFTTTSCLPAVFQFPEDAEVTAQDVHDALDSEEWAVVSPYIDQKEDGAFFYTSGRVYRIEADPDFQIRADANSLRLFETPYEAEEPLPRLSFEEFADIISGIEDALDIEFLPYEDDE
jgi:hypothetical protein